MPGSGSPPVHRYARGYPRAVVRVVAGELVAAAIVAALFVVLPAVIAWFVFTGPWHLAVPWHLSGLPIAVALAAVACWAARGLASDVRERFGLRVVPQFARRLDPGPDSYLSGRQIAAQLRRLDAMAVEGGVSPLSRYGFGRRGDVPHAWFDAAHGSATVAALLARVEPSSPLHRELATWLAALRRAEAAHVEFRLVVVSGTAMNGPLWDALRDEGF